MTIYLFINCCTTAQVESPNSDFKSNQCNSIEVISYSYGDLSCMGTLVGKNTILTAAHCIDPWGIRTKTITITNKKNIDSSDSYTHKTNKTGQFGAFTPLKVFIHPQYKKQTDYYGRAYDLAIILLQANSKNQKEQLKPQCPRMNFTSKKLNPGISMDTITFTQQKVKILQNTAQSKYFIDLLPADNTVHLFSGFCPGDSGTPLWIKKNDINIIAILSDFYGKPVSSKQHCSEGGRFVKLDQIWLNMIIRKINLL
ncbi:MAG: trypsin-like serine protease [Bdellovibrionota bacterium]